MGSPPRPVDIERLGLFVSKLSPDGASLVYSTIVVHGRGMALAVDPAGRAHVTGAAADPDLPGDARRWDAVAAVLSPDGSQVERLLRFGGSESDIGFGIELDAAGAVHVVGETSSTDFPTLRPGLPQPPDTSNFFVTKFDATGATVYSTYLGGSGGEFYFPDIAVDAGGTAYVAGQTSSPDFPGAGAPVVGRSDAFVTVLDPAGSLARSRLLGGSAGDWATAIAVDAAGRVHLAGGTHSPDFPLRDPLQSQCAPLNEFSDNVECFADAFVAVLGPGAEQLLFSTYLGGAEFASGYPPEDAATGIAVDAAGNVHVTGWAYSAGFPTLNAFQPFHAPVREGENDAFITKIALGLPLECASAVARPAVLWPPDGRLVPISITGVTDPDGDPVTIRVTGIRQDEALTGAFDAAGVGTAQATVRAARDGRGDGRVYRVSFEASDASGGVCAGEVTVCVPHDRRPGAACGDGGALFDSIR